jgi:hypothetical protein
MSFTATPSVSRPDQFLTCSAVGSPGSTWAHQGSRCTSLSGSPKTSSMRHRDTPVSSSAAWKIWWPCGRGFGHTTSAAGRLRQRRQTSRARRTAALRASNIRPDSSRGISLATDWNSASSSCYTNSDTQTISSTTRCQSECSRR